MVLSGLPTQASEPLPKQFTKANRRQKLFPFAYCLGDVNERVNERLLYRLHSAYLLNENCVANATRL